MNYKIIISLILSVSFLFFGNSFVLGAMPENVSVDSISYDSGILTATISYVLQYENYQSICFHTVDGYGWTLDMRNPNYILSTAYAYGVNSNANFAGYNGYCFTPGNSVELRFIRLWVNGSSLSGQGDLTKTLIDNQFGNDFLETNAIFNVLSFYGYTGTQYDPITSSGWEYESWDFPYLSSVNGVCGSANGGSFPELLDNDPDLCSSGTNSLLGVQTDGTNFFWTCIGSGEGTNDLCSATVLVSSAQCGSANGTNEITTEPTGTLACYVGSITDMTQEVDNSFSWTCTVSENDYQSCMTFSEFTEIPPTLPSDESITCSISPTDFSTFGDCLGSILSWLFLPKQVTLNNFYSMPQTLQTKVPFGYFYSGADLFKSFSVTVPDNLVIPITVYGHEMTLLDVNDLKSEVGVYYDYFFQFVRACMWLTFIIWVYNKGRNLFGSNDDEK